MFNIPDQNEIVATDIIMSDTPAVDVEVPQPNSFVHVIPLSVMHMSSRTLSNSST